MVLFFGMMRTEYFQATVVTLESLIGGESPMDAVPKYIPKGQETDKLAAWQFVLINTINVIIYAAGSIAVIMIIIGGIRYMTAVGGEDEIGNAKKMILYAALGLLIIIFAFVIVQNIVSYITPKAGEEGGKIPKVKVERSFV